MAAEDRDGAAPGRAAVPDRPPLSPRWHWRIGLTVISGLAFDAQTLLDPAAMAVTDRPVPPLIGPAAFHAADPLWALATLLLVGVLAASVAELVVRFRRARGAERLQLTRLVWAVVLFAVLNSQRWITGNGPILLLLTLPLVPSAAAVAILRHDLYDIRVIVNRTLVCGLLTALLGLAYAGGVLVLGQLAGRDHNSLAVAGATLAVAAPLSDELLAVVDQTMQPTTAALWLRPSAHAMPGGGRRAS